MLVTPAGQWHILDWDDLSLGDSAMDWAMLWGPTREQVCSAGMLAGMGQMKLSEAALSRVQLYARASLLDWIIDPLADWVQAGQEPIHGAEVRAANEIVHTQALRCYRNRYG
jgi:aminoglycoside phosphotransferase (APT) family kinase protein